MRETTRTTILLLAAMGAGYLGGLLSQTTHRAAAQAPQPAVQDVIRTKKLELVDDSGRMRGVFTVNDIGPSLILADSEGRTRGYFGLDYKGPFLYLADAGGKTRGEFRLTDRGPSLGLWDKEGTERAMLGVESLQPVRSGEPNNREESSLVLFDIQGREMLQLPK